LTDAFEIFINLQYNTSCKPRSFRAMADFAIFSETKFESSEFLAAEHDVVFNVTVIIRRLDASQTKWYANVAILGRSVPVTAVKIIRKSRAVVKTGVIGQITLPQLAYKFIVYIFGRP